MEITFLGSQTDLIRRHFQCAECCTSFYDRGNFYGASSFQRSIWEGAPSAPRHMTVGWFPWSRVNTKGEGFVSENAPCVIPWTYIEPEVESLEEAYHEVMIVMQILESEGLDLDQCHLVYSGNTSLWLGIPSGALGNPMGAVKDQAALREYTFLPWMETQVDTHFWNGRHLRRMVGSRHETGGRVQVFPAAYNFRLSWIGSDQPDEARAVMWSDPFEAVPCEKLVRRMAGKRTFHVPAMDEVERDFRQSSFLSDTAEGVGRGQRNDVTFRRACSLLNQYDRDEVERRLLAWNKKNDPPLQEKEVRQCIISAQRMHSRGR